MSRPGAALAATLGNTEWVEDHKEELKDLLPATWTHATNFNPLKFGFGLKLLGIDWRSQDELALVLAWMEKTGFLLRNGLQLKRNHHA